MEFRFGELFCGPGGLAFAAKSAKVEANGQLYSISHAWATDYDKDTCATYRHNICPDNPKSVVCCDVRKLSLKKLEKTSPIDALAFGFPCNDYSVVGEQRGMDGVYGPLYSYGVKALKYFQPKFFLAENVGGLRNANDGKSLDKILHELEQAGYVITPHLYKFEQYGVPQARHRIIIIGIRKDLKVNFFVPAPDRVIPASCREAFLFLAVADNLTKEQRHKTMQAIRSKGTTPERLVMLELKRRKIYFASHVDTLFGKPDIVFKRKKIAVFIDSDFWHGHPKRCIMPKTNIDYWSNKIAQNRNRDKKVNRILKQNGWKVVRMWEFDVKKHLEKSVKKILSELGKN